MYDFEIIFLYIYQTTNEIMLLDTCNFVDHVILFSRGSLLFKVGDRGTGLASVIIAYKLKSILDYSRGTTYHTYTG